MDETLRYKIALSLVPGLTPSVARLLLEHFGTAERVFAKENVELLKHLHPKIGQQLHDENPLKRADKEIEILIKNQIRCVYIDDPDYPYRLHTCPDAPIVLYSRGHSDLNAKKVIAVVGTRQATIHGKSTTECFVRDLAQSFPDIVVVSGLAYGIDVCAHRAALKNQINTVAVLAHGLQRVYPLMHREVAKKMLENGSLITELAWGTPCEPWRFVQRNRIVAGLSDACIVVESAEKGGSLITAQMASGYGRDVFAFPGRSCDFHSKGCNLLVKTRVASLIESVSDLMGEMNWEVPTVGKEKQTELFPKLSLEEEHLYRLLETGDKYNSTQLAVQTGFRISEILSLLMQLEIKQLIDLHPGGLYSKKNF